MSFIPCNAIQIVKALTDNDPDVKYITGRSIWVMNFAIKASTDIPRHNTVYTATECKPDWIYGDGVTLITLTKTRDIQPHHMIGLDREYYDYICRRTKYLAYTESIPADYISPDEVAMRFSGHTSTDDHISTANYYTSATNYYTPATNYYTPATNDYTPATNDYTPATNDYTPATNDYTPATNDYTPATRRSKRKRGMLLFILLLGLVIFAICVDVYW